MTDKDEIADVELEDLSTGILANDGLGASREFAGRKVSVLSKLPCKLEWLRNLEQAFGYKHLVMLFSSQHSIKGVAASFTTPAAQYLYAGYNVKGPRMQILTGISGLPWTMKPIIGLVSDMFPICGYNKAPYMLLASVIGAGALGTLGFTTPETLSLQNAVVCLFLMIFQYSVCDLLTEAKYAEKLREHPEQGPDLMSFVWFGMYLGGLAATSLVGVIMDHVSRRAPFLVAMIPCSLIILPLSRNYMEEKPKAAGEIREARCKLMEQREALGLCLLMFVFSILLTVLGIRYESIYLNCGAAIAVSLIMLTSFVIVLRPVIAKVNCFFLLQTSFALQMGGAMFYFFTDTPDMYPEGPHFSMEFFTSGLGTLGSVCSLIGIYMYRRFMKDWPYRRLILLTNLTLGLLNGLDVVLLTRTNIRWGIPDHAFVLGASALQTIIFQWMWMPGVVILSQLCPKGMEATMYALLAGCQNLGQTMAANCGALVLHFLDCQPSGQPNETKQFANLWKASAIATLLPLCTLMLLPILIPDARQTDRLLGEEDRDATAGSLLRRWTGS